MTMQTDRMPQAASAAPRKVPTMRKGTRSCFECRKRKVRCIFGKDSTICETCITKGKRCVEQRRDMLQEAALDTRESLREQVARLEAMVQALTNGPGSSESVSQTLEAKADSSRSSSPSGVGKATPTPTISSASDVTIDKSSPQNIDPIVTLFDNAIWRPHSSQLAQERSTEIAVNPAIAAKHLRTRELLLSGFLSSDVLVMILSASCSWWYTWRPLGAWLSSSIGNVENSTLQDFVFAACESSNPPTVSLALLCIAVCLQQLDTRVHQYILRQLPRLPGEIFQEYFEKVEHLIINDSDYASTEEGIEVTIFAAKIYMNLGLNKKCWVLSHRAISYSQLLGYHRPERISVQESLEERHRRNESWLALCSGDVYLSLLLGLPYAADGRTIPMTRSEQDPVSLLKHKLIIMSGKVIDRNQMGLSLSVSRTDEIEKEIEASTKTFDKSFWNCQEALASGHCTRPEYLERLAAQCWLYQLKVFLHMPLMIQSVDDSQLEKHRVSCLNASRNLLRIYHVMRSDKYSAFDMVKLIDYQAFICSALLVLGILGYGGSEVGTTNREKDRNLIDLTINILRQASNTVNNPIALQAVEGLENLMLLEGGNCSGQRNHNCVNPHVRILVPHIGTIIIRPGEHFTKSPKDPVPVDDLQPLPVFAFSYDTFQEPSRSQVQPPSLASNANFDGAQLGDSEFQNVISQELAVIDFDWSVTSGFENDWAWLNEPNYQVL